MKFSNCVFPKMNGDRDEGDGSSNGTMNGQEEMMQSSGADSDGQITPTPTPIPSHGGGEHGKYILACFLSFVVCPFA